MQMIILCNALMFYHLMCDYNAFTLFRHTRYIQMKVICYSLLLYIGAVAYDAYVWDESGLRDLMKIQLFYDPLVIKLCWLEIMKRNQLS